MQTESTTRSRFSLRRREEIPEVPDEPIVAGRLEWVTTLSREQLAEIAGRSRTLASSARTRVTPATDLSSVRSRLPRRGAARQATPLPEPEDAGSSVPWMLIAVVASLVSLLVFIAARRSRQSAEEQAALEFAMETDMVLPEDGTVQPTQMMHNEHGFDDMVAPSP